MGGTFPQSSFRFMDLPVEIRLMVYELLPNQTIRTKFSTAPPRDFSSSFTLVTNTLPVNVLRVCEEVNQEAGPTIQKRLSETLKPYSGHHFASLRPHIETDAQSPYYVGSGPLSQIIRYLCVRDLDERKQLVKSRVVEEAREFVIRSEI